MTKENYTKLCITRYGNVMGSRGSVIPRFINLVKMNKPLPVTDLRMTRFMISLDQSVDLVLHALIYGKNGDIFVQKSPACKIIDLAKAIHIFLKKTRLGFFIYAIGDNMSAARISGIRVRPIIILQYVLCAVIALFAGLVLAASSNSMDTRIFNLTWIYDVILVVVLGGIGLSGGRGGVMNVIVGTLLIGTIINGMTILNVSFQGQNLVRGLVLLSALMIDSILNPRNEETAKQGDI